MKINLYPEMNEKIADMLSNCDEPMYQYAGAYIKSLQSERDTLKKVLTELIQTGEYNFCELCGAECVDAGLDYVKEMSQCGCFILRGIQQAQEQER